MGEIDKEYILGCLYEKTYTCPVCDNVFKNKTVKSGRTRAISTDIDLKPIYDKFNPMYYSVVTCQLCGYTSLDSTFDRIGLKQGIFVRQTLAQKFVARQYPEIYDAKTAIIRYKLALICADLKKAKKGEFAVIALRLSWFYEELENEAKAQEYRTYACNLFKEAYSSENFPIFGYDEATVAYIIGALNYKLGNYDEAFKYISRVILMRNIKALLKTKAEDLKELIKKAKEENNNTDK